MNIHQELASFVDELKGVDPSCVHIENIGRDDQSIGKDGHRLKEWATLAEEYRKVKNEAAAIAQREAQIKQDLVDLCGSETSVQRDGLKVHLVIAKGNIEWRKIPEVVRLSEDYLEGYRGKEKSFWKVSFCA